MANTLMTEAEVRRDIVLPLLAAFKADMPAVEASAREAFARGAKVYREVYCGMAIEILPADFAHV